MVPRIVIVAVFASVIALTCGQVHEDPQPFSTTTASTTTTTKPTPPPTTEPTPPPTTKPTPPSTTKPTPPPTTKPSTTTQTTPTTQTTSPTTPPPTTPSTKPTTPPPTTKPTSPTTPPSTTPTPAPSTTTSKPSPQPSKPEVGNWNVTDKTNKVTCILVDMAVQLNVTYTAVDNKTHCGIIDIPKTANATGECGNYSQWIILKWSEKNETGNELILTFTMNNASKRFMISMINVTLNPNQTAFPWIADNKTLMELYNNNTEFPTALKKSYRCDKEQTFNLMMDGTNKTVANIMVSHVHLEAFHEKEDRNFGDEENCETSSSPDIVPIAVGCGLVGLVAIVLIAYLVGRRRSQARGYLSM